MEKEELMNALKNVGESAVDSVKHSLSIKKVGLIQIDEENKMFKIDLNGSNSSAIKKATWAVFTGGLSLAAEAASKGIKNIGNSWISFEKLVSYDCYIDNERITSGVGGRVRIAKGVSVGSHQRVSKNVTTSLKFMLKIDDLNCPYIEIPIIKKPLCGKDFDKAMKLKNETEAGLEYIIKNQ
ncbi:hypothetical protein [Floccifex sp.]|uniref:hypothetical protein n=1 Tax=Floccifex sp. TaxID=2815810 RepID=UPI003F08D29A